MSAPSSESGSGSSTGLAAARKGANSRLSVNAALNALGSVAHPVALVLLTPVAIGALGQDGWGLWELAGAAASYSMLLNLGLNSAVSYHVAQGAARDDVPLLHDAINNARWYLVAAGALILLLLGLLGRPLMDSLVQDPLKSIAFTTLLVSVGITALSLPIRVHSSVLSGFQRYDLLAVGRLVAVVVFVVGVLLGFRSGMGIVGFAALMSLVPAVPSLVSWLAGLRLLPRGARRWVRPNLPLMREMLGFGVSTVMYTTGTVLLFQSMKLIASWNCGGVAQAGQMGLAINLVKTLSVLFLPIAGVLQARASDLQGRGRSAELPGLLQRSLAAVALLAVPLFFFLAAEAETLFAAWVGRVLDPPVIRNLADTSRWMLVGQGLYVLSLPAFYAVVGMGEHRFFGLGMLSAGIANCLLGWFATLYVPEIETLGLAFSISLVVLVIFVVAPGVAKRVGIRMSGVLRESILVPTAISVPGVLVSVFRPHVDSALLDLILAGLLFGVASLPGLVWARGRLRAGRAES